MITKNLAAVLMGWLARIIVIACSLLNTRLLLGMLDVSDYAVYAIVLSLGPWFNLLNLGVPNTAQNAVAQHRAEQRDYGTLQQTVVNTAAMAALAAILLSGPAGWLLRHTLLSSYPDISSVAVALLCFGLCLTGLGLVFNQVLFALHRSIWPNVMPGVQALTTTAVLVTLQQLGLISMEWAVASFVVPASLSFLVMASVAGASPRGRINALVLRDLLRGSRPFLLFGILSTATLSADYIVMARILSEHDIVEYNLAGKVFAVLLTVHAVVLSTAWSGLSDLHYGGAHRLLRRRVGQLLLVGALVVTLPALLIIYWQHEIFQLITGSRGVPVSAMLLGAWPVYLLTRVWCDTFALAHMSSGRMSVLNIYIPIQALCSVGAQVLLGQRFGPAGVLIGIIFSFLLTAAWILPIQFIRATRTAKDMQ